MFIEKANKKIKASEERTFILNKKCEMLETKIQETDDICTIVGNITPVEVEENCNTKEISVVLEECAKKLEQVLKNIPLSNVQGCNNSQVLYSSKKPNKQSFIEKYLSNSKKKSARKSSAVKMKLSSFVDKENKHSKCMKKLFNDETLDSETKPVKRESLGLLPESCLEDDNFATLTIDVLQEIEINSSLVQKSAIIHENILFNSQPFKQTLEKLCKHQVVTENLSKLLHTENRQIIWNIFENLNNNLHLTIVQNLVFDQRKNM